jgi:lipopolysaccharide cholinephosphotransferase
VSITTESNFVIWETLMGRFFLVLFFILPVELFCSSPRILITLGPKCTFTPEKLQKKIECLVVSGPAEGLKEKILELDRSESTHIVVYTGQLHDQRTFSRTIAYESVILNSSLKSALRVLKRLIPTIPRTDVDLPRMKPYDAGRLYDLMMKVDCLFKQHDLSYWAMSGTLLGAVRHEGVIPWDDDLDVAICAEDIPSLEKLEGMLADMGLGMAYYSESQFYKIFPLDGEPIFKKGEVRPWRYPFIDIFPFVVVGDKRIYMSEVWRKRQPNEFFYSGDLSSSPMKLPFGPMMIPVPREYLDYVKRVYGEDWNSVAYLQFDHKHGRRRKKIRVDLVDRSAPHYILPYSAR